MGRSLTGLRPPRSGYKAEAGAILQKLDQLGFQGSRRGHRKGCGGEERPAVFEIQAGSRPLPSCGAETAIGKKFCADCGRKL